MSRHRSMIFFSSTKKYAEAYVVRTKTVKSSPSQVMLLYFLDGCSCCLLKGGEGDLCWPAVPAHGMKLGNELLNAACSYFQSLLIPLFIDLSLPYSIMCYWRTVLFLSEGSPSYRVARSYLFPSGGLKGEF